MIRLLLLLCAGIYATLQIAGQDRGQQRFGLMEAERAAQQAAQDAAEAALQAPKALDLPTQNAAAAAPAPVAQAEAVPATATPVVFTPVTRLVTPVPQRAPQPAAAEAAPEEIGTVQYVTGRSVNVRSGPSTSDEVIGRLSLGDEVRVVWLEDNGWARVRVEGDGIDGFMAASFLTDTAP